MCYGRVFAFVHLKVSSILQYFAVPGQEFLGLLVAVRLQEHIHRIFPDALHQRKREDTLKTWKRDCPGQFLCGSKYALSENSKWSSSPNWSISYYFLYKNEPFFRHKGVPPRVIFHIRCQNFVAGLAHTLCELIHRIWTLPRVWDKECGNVFLEPPGQLQKWK